MHTLSVRFSSLFYFNPEIAYRTVQTALALLCKNNENSRDKKFSHLGTFKKTEKSMGLFQHILSVIKSILSPAFVIHIFLQAGPFFNTHYVSNSNLLFIHSNYDVSLFQPLLLKYTVSFN